MTRDELEDYINEKEYNNLIKKEREIIERLS